MATRGAPDDRRGDAQGASRSKDRGGEGGTRRRRGPLPRQGQPQGQPRRHRAPAAHGSGREHAREVALAAGEPADSRGGEGASAQPDIPPDLTNPAELRALLRRHGVLKPNKALGQHLLVSKAALAEVVAAAELAPTDAVLEVGAGTGVLTVELAERAGRVVAVELDRAMLPVLRETTARFPNVEILPRNLLDVEPAALFNRPYKLVANLPYYITALTLRHFLEAALRPCLLVVMVQREVAERMVAQGAQGGKGGEMSLLALSVQFYGRPRIVGLVPPDAFFPPPKVESAIVQVEVYAEPPLPPAARERLFQLAHAGFAEKRKQLHNSLERNLDVAPETIRCWLAQADIDPQRRAQTLTLADWIRLTEVSLSGVCADAYESAD